MELKYSSEELYSKILKIYNAFDDVKKDKAGEPKTPKNGFDQMRQYFRKIKIIAKDHDNRHENDTGKYNTSDLLFNNISSDSVGEMHSFGSGVKIGTQISHDSQETICTRDSESDFNHPIKVTSNLPHTVLPNQLCFTNVYSKPQHALAHHKSIPSNLAHFGMQYIKDQRTIDIPDDIALISNSIGREKNMSGNSGNIIVRGKVKFFELSIAELIKNVCSICGFPIDGAINCTYCRTIAGGRKKDWFTKIVIADESAKLMVVLKSNDASTFFGCTVANALTSKTISAQVEQQIELYKNDSRFYLFGDVIGYNMDIDKPFNENLFLILVLTATQYKYKEGNKIFYASLRS